MTLPASGPISFSQINTELSLTANAAINMNDAAVRTLGGRVGANTAISMNDFYGKSFSYSGTLAFNNAQTIYVNGSSLGIAYATVQLQPNGSISYFNDTGNFADGPTAYLSPLHPVAGAEFEARLSIFNVEFFDGGYYTVFDSIGFTRINNVSTAYYPLNVNRIIQVVPSQGDSVLMNFTLEIRKIGTTAPVISRNGTIEASY